MGKFLKLMLKENEKIDKMFIIWCWWLKNKEKKILREVDLSRQIFKSGDTNMS